MPPESSEGMRSRAPRRPTVSSFISTTLRRIGSGSRVCSRIGNATFSNNERSVNSAPVWNSSAMRFLSSNRSLVERSGTEMPSTRIAPESGLRLPPMRFRSVVLPQPLPPMMAVTEPRRMAMVTPFRIGRSPRANCTSRMSTRTSSFAAPLRGWFKRLPFWCAASSCEATHSSALGRICQGGSGQRSATPKMGKP